MYGWLNVVLSGSGTMLMPFNVKAAPAPLHSRTTTSTALAAAATPLDIGVGRTTQMTTYLVTFTSDGHDFTTEIPEDVYEVEYQELSPAPHSVEEYVCKMKGQL